MTTIRYHVSLGREGSNNALGYTIDATRRLTADEEAGIVAALAADFTGVNVTLDSEEIRPTTDDPANAIMRSLVREVEQLWPDALKGAKPDPQDARMNELERGLKMQERALGNIGNSLKLIESLVMDLAASRTVQQAAQPYVTMNRGPEPGTVLATVNLPTEVKFAESVRQAPLVIDEQRFLQQQPVDPPTQQQQMAASKGFPLVGTPTFVAGDPTAPTNPNARGNGRTHEMMTGQMSLAGREPRSQVISYSGAVDSEGKPIFATHQLPKVGDSLKPQSAQSDIEVPK